MPEPELAVVEPEPDPAPEPEPELQKEPEPQPEPQAPPEPEPAPPPEAPAPAETYTRGRHAALPVIDTTLGAIPVNAKCQVLTDDKTVIPGLYAVGQDASNFWGHSYYQTEHTNALTQGWSITSGRLAGIAIAESYGKQVPFVTWTPAKGKS